jgi:hypothetical protein
MPINSLKPLFDKFERSMGDRAQMGNTLSLRDSEPASPIDATEVSECQSFGDGTTLAAAKTKAKAACLSHI